MHNTSALQQVLQTLPLILSQSGGEHNVKLDLEIAKLPWTLRDWHALPPAGHRLAEQKRQCCRGTKSTPVMLSNVARHFCSDVHCCHEHCGPTSKIASPSVGQVAIAITWKFISASGHT
jgi:hypothetical protein